MDITNETRQVMYRESEQHMVVGPSEELAHLSS